jgi:hypothetical protein
MKVKKKSEDIAIVDHYGILGESRKRKEMRKRFRHKKIIEYHCPKCNMIYTKNEGCLDCMSRLVRRSYAN